MNPINLLAHFGNTYQIGHDEAATTREDKSDPWYYLIPCKHGHIYPHSGKLLAVYCDRPGLLPRLRRTAGLIPHQIGDQEAIYLFPPELFEQVADIVKAKRKRRLSAEAKVKRLERLRGHDSTPEIALKTGGISTQERVSEPEPLQTAGSLRSCLRGTQK